MTKVEVNISGLDNEIRNLIDDKIRLKLQSKYKDIDDFINEALSKIDFDKLIIDKLNKIVAQSKYFKEDIIRNLIQQKIARDIKTEKDIKSNLN